MSDCAILQNGQKLPSATERYVAYLRSPVVSSFHTQFASMKSVFRSI